MASHASIASEPCWLRHFCSIASFFQPCAKCSSSHSQREATTNFYCLQSGEELCSVCAHGRTSGTMIQVRRSSYHDVVRQQDIAKLADVGGIQSYTINGARVLFLRRRPQPRPPKGAVGASQCTVCSRHLQDVSLYCSLQCKLDALSGGCSSSAATPPPSQQQQQQLGAPQASPAGSDSSGSHTGPETPSHLRALRQVDSSSDTESMDGEELYFEHKRRKGSPSRAPLE